MMRFPTLQRHAPSVVRVAAAAAAALVVFTGASALVGAGRAYATPASGNAPYAVRLRTVKTAESTVLTVTLSENGTSNVVALQPVRLGADRIASLHTSESGLDVDIDVRPGSGEALLVSLDIFRDGRRLQKAALTAVPSGDGGPAKKYQGEPISMTLRGADLRDVLLTFGKLTGTRMELDDSVQGTVNVSWINVPWDQALDTLLQEQGMTYRIDGQTIYVTKKQ